MKLPRPLSAPFLRLALTAVGGSVAIAALVLWLMGAFHEKVAPAPARETLPLPPAAPTLTVQTVETVVFESAVGTIEPVHRIEIGAQLLARVAHMHVKSAGQPCQAGEVLVELDSADLTAALEERRAAHRAAVASLEQSRRDLQRTEQLHERQVAAADRLERDRTAVARAEAEVQRTAQAVAGAETQLGYATIRAPVTGIVVDKLVEEGDLARPGQVLLTLYDPSALQLVASVRESLAAGLRVNDTVRVHVDALDKTCDANVAQIVPEAQAQSRAFSVKVTGPCPPGVYSGMFGRLEIPVGTRQEILVPGDAVRSVGQLDMVFAVTSEGRLLRRFVLLGRREDERVEVLSGLRAGDVILADHQQVPAR